MDLSGIYNLYGFEDDDQMFPETGTNGWFEEPEANAKITLVENNAR